MGPVLCRSSKAVESGLGWIPLPIPYRPAHSIIHRPQDQAARRRRRPFHSDHDDASMRSTRSQQHDVQLAASGWRLPRFTLRKKSVPSSPIIADSLAIDTRNPSPHHPPNSPTIHQSPPPSAHTSFDPPTDDRFSRSYNSSETRSSDSQQNIGQQSNRSQTSTAANGQRIRGSPYRSASHTPLSSTTSTAVSNPPQAASSSARKPEKYRLLSRLSNNNFKTSILSSDSQASTDASTVLVTSPVGTGGKPLGVTSPQSPQFVSQSATTSPASKGQSSSGSAASRFIRRVASAPNAKRLFGPNPNGSSATTKNGLLAAPAEIDPVPPLPPTPTFLGGSATASPPVSASDLGGGGSIDTLSSKSSTKGGKSFKSGTRPIRANSVAALTSSGSDRHQRDPPAGGPHGVHTSVSPNPGQTPRQAFRRTYSSNSIKVKSVQVNPSSFQKVKLLGRGDVGRVYLVREKKSDKLFAMKGEVVPHRFQ